MSGKLGIDVWYLFNSGFALKYGERLLIFDCYNSSPYKKRQGLDGGVIDPQELRELDVAVFSSHAHMDHFVPGILKWGREIPRLRYVLSYDIDARQTANVTTAYPDASYMVEDMRVRTLKSNDEGVAFAVEMDGLKIYHGGDLNWWHWEGEPEEENRAMAEAYKAALEKLRDERFDIAFVPVDPRLENEYLWGLDYFMQTVDARIVFPMHFRNTYSVIARLMADPLTIPYRDRIMPITRRGERFEI